MTKSSMNGKMRYLIIIGIYITAGMQVSKAAEHPVDNEGKAAYIEMRCHECHGFQGQGGGNGPRIAPSTLPAEAFDQIVRKPYGGMPAYPESELSDEKLRLIHRYLLTIHQPPEPDSIPALSLD